MKPKTFLAAPFICALALSLLATRAFAQAQDADALAKSLANPVAALISVPFQGNFDSGYANGGWRSTLNIQPVIPIKLNENWNLIQRAVMPIIVQKDAGAPGSESGLGDTVATSFFSPKAPTASGWIWGAGPVFLLPTATNDAFASKKLGVGPSALALKQDGPWTYGVLINQLWSVAGSDSRPDVSAMFLQPSPPSARGRGVATRPTSKAPTTGNTSSGRSRSTSWPAR